MKRTMLLTAAYAGLILTTLTSNSSGPANSGNGDRTGRINASRTCASAGCHGAVTSDLGVSVTFRDKSTGLPLSGGYVPGNIYEVQLDAVNGINANIRFGFQVATVKANNTQAGSFNAVGLNTLYRVSNSAGIQLLEHRQAISVTGNAYQVIFDWTAPATGSGPVTLWAIFNAVNGNLQADAGDRSSMPFSTTIQESSLHVNASLSAEKIIRLYPNPVTDYLNIEMAHLESGRYQVSVFDLTGKKMYTNDFLVNLNMATLRIPSGGWSPGMYAIHVSGAGVEWVIPFVCQQ